jgi:hypothetical protein
MQKEYVVVLKAELNQYIDSCFVAMRAGGYRGADRSEPARAVNKAEQNLDY